MLLPLSFQPLWQGLAIGGFLGGRCGTSDANIQFSGLCRLLINLGIEERIKGDHHIFTKDGIEEIINLQPKQGKVKPYQVKQVRNIFLLYKLGDN